jgi:hypothetical protein
MKYPNHKLTVLQIIAILLFKIHCCKLVCLFSFKFSQTRLMFRLQMRDRLLVLQLMIIGLTVKNTPAYYTHVFTANLSSFI